MLQIFFAFIAGLLTVAAPCILPMLPIILGASVGQTNKQRPLFIVMGFILSFAAASLILSVIVGSLGLSQDVIRTFAIIILGIFGIFMVWSTPFEMLTTKMSGVINKANQLGQSQSGNTGALFLGLVLGIVWAPCAGPVLASILALIALQGLSLKAVILVLVYALGAGIPMLLIAYGSQYLTTKIHGLVVYAGRLQQIFGVLIILLAVAMYFQYDTKINNALTAFFPQNGLEQKLVAVDNNQTVNNMEKIQLQNYGKAPEFTGISKWLNLPAGQAGSDALTMESLKGKVVLVDFWTYSCINCIRTLPYVTKWYDTYHDKNFVVIGVHTPEFPFEKVADNVQTAIKRFGINYPVAQDNDYGTWQAFNNQYWPAEYLIDQNGNIVYTHFGEGNYDHTENAIRQLLGLDKPVSAEEGNSSADELSHVGSPEMYFEPSRLEYLSADQTPSLSPKPYTLPANLRLNNFALEGQWKFTDDHAESTAPNAKIRLHFSSGKVFMVAASDKPLTIHIIVDGKPQQDVTIQMSQLYTLFDSTDYSEHTLEIEIPDPGFQAFTFTFG